MEVTEEWGESEARIWFRRHCNGEWPLLPGIYRAEELKDREDDLRHDFHSRSIPYFEGAGPVPGNNWEWYFIMQHYGVATRLLDWSESALVALYFALRDHNRDHGSAAVWVLDPWFLNDAFVGKSEVLDPEKDAQAYLHEPYGDSSGMPSSPIAIRARHNSRRIAAQRGVFTLHGCDPLPLDACEKLAPRLAKIEITASSVGNIRRQLARAGITDAVVFPELLGIGREVLDYWRGLA